MTQKEIEDCWRDPRNYKGKWLKVYYCKADPRVIVPRRRKWMGWTVNFAHPCAIPMILLSFAIAVVPSAIVSLLLAPIVDHKEGTGTGIVGITLAQSIAILCLMSAWLSSRTE